MTLQPATREPFGARPLRLGGMRRIGFLLSSLLLGASGALVVPLVVALGYGETGIVEAFTQTIFVGVAFGAPGLFLLRTDLVHLSRREGLAVVALGWALVSLLGALPFAFSGTLGPVNAWFESISGFTGTGATVIPDVESLPRGIIFWRSFTHWLGGMGFVLLYVALFPLLGVGAMQLYRAEVPGLEVDRLRPRIRSTAQILWVIYGLLSAALTVFLLLGGMNLFEAVCQMFATIGTGGFSTRNASIGGFESAYIDWVLIVFMCLGATNFALHWAVLTGRPQRLLKNPEWRFFMGVLVTFSLIVVLLLWIDMDFSLAEALRRGVFEVVSMGTTTGFANADYELWPPLAQYLIFMLLFMGGCAGSTAGSMKAIRVQLFSKQALRGMFQTVHPRALAPPRLGEKAVTGDMIRAVFSFVSLYLLTWMVGTALITLIGIDFVTATSAVASSMGNFGPALGDVGPTETYVWMHPAAKGILGFCMLAGRLELFTVLLLFSPAYWRR